MTSLFDKVLARVYRGDTDFSRNRNFDAYEDRSVQRAAAAARRLRRLAESLREHGSSTTLSVTRAADADGRIRLELTPLHGTQIAFVTAFELQLLYEDPVLAQLLGQAKGRHDAQGW